ncbi:MAG TPA: DUF1697 domain-containing protein [Sphingomonas sp.]|nr:DUF1697 domain-containing protein [Sphingomonas sp.]
MTAYIALLRAVNVGGTGKLLMTELKRIGQEAGFANARTYLASGNLLFECSASEAAVKAALEAGLEAYAGKPVGVLVRTADEMAAVAAANPFPTAAPNRVVAIFLDDAPPADALDHATGRRDEELRLGKRELYVHYGEGIADSKLRIPAARDGTARNMNSVTRLAELAGADRAGA